MVALLVPADEHDTEPMAAVREHNAEQCGVDGCHRSASLMRCVMCGLALCERHAHMRWLDGKNQALCPEHKGER